MQLFEFPRVTSPKRSISAQSCQIKSNSFPKDWAAALCVSMLLLLAGPAVAAPDSKAIVKSEKKTDKALMNLIYFKSSTVALAVFEGGSQILRSSDEGVTWESPKLLESLYPIVLVGTHDVDNRRGYFFTESDIHVTTDRLESKLDKLDTPVKYNQLGVQILDFHPTETDYLVFMGSQRGCPDPSKCFTEAYISFDAGISWENSRKPIETWATKCVWAWDQEFGKGGTKLPKDAVFCASYKYKNGKIGQDQLGWLGPRSDNPLQLVLLTNKGKDRRVLIDGGLVNFYVVDNLLVAAVDLGHDLRMKISTDGETFVDAKFPPNLQVQRNAFTVLESSSGGVFMDLSQSQQFQKEYGSLFKSNSNGTFYSRILENSNRNEKGIVDFDKMKGIPGIIIANQVQNVNEMMSGASKKVKSKITFDAGNHWESLSAPKKDSDGNTIKCSTSTCELHVYSKSNDFTPGKSSSHTSQAAAGIMIAVGSVGDYLKPYMECDTFLTKDAGRTWIEIKRDAHKWAIGDHGGLIVLANDEQSTDTISYSWNYGASWAEYKFADNPIRVLSISTEPSATSLKFTIIGIRPKTSDRSFESVLVGLDFSKLLPKACEKPSTKKDLDVWVPSKDGKDRCFLGEEVEFYRKKDGAECYIGHEFETDFGKVESCACTELDFECDYNFFRDSSGECKLFGADPARPIGCKEGEKYKGSSGYRKIAISKCKGGVDLSEPKERTCVGAGSPSDGPVAAGQVKMATHLFKHKLSDYFYFNQTRIVFIRDVSGRVWRSFDAGLTWDQPAELKSLDIDFSMLDSSRADHRAYFISSDKFFHYTDDAGKTIHKVDLPSLPNRLGIDPLVLHHVEPNYLIFVGDSDCDAVVSDKCRAEAYVSTNLGRNWNRVASYVQKCAFGKDKRFVKPGKDTIFCQEFDVTSGNQRSMMVKTTKRKLSKSDNLGKSWSVELTETVGFAISYEYMVVAKLPEGSNELKLMVSLDGDTWNPAAFENDDKIPDYGYTLLDSSSGSVFLQVFSSRHHGGEFGALYRSTNNNGTMYKISLEHVNQDSKGYTDFEKVLGLPGIAIANEVLNYDKVRSGTGVPKRIRSKISFNDGERWFNLQPPSRDVNGDSYKCSEDCYLNLHHFTERSDSNDLFSSASAVGFMMGVGNVGPYLSDYNDGDTFITKDAGKTWREVAKHAHLYEFGNRGGVILLANNEIATDGVKYSLNHGDTFTDLKITEQLNGAKLRVTNIITEPYGSSSSFVLFGVLNGGSNHGDIAAVHLDFSKVWDRECKMDKQNAGSSDYEVWNPSGSSSSTDQCLFGQKTDYFRRRPDSICKAPEVFDDLVSNITPCLCTIDDFECDVGYARNSSGLCSPSSGFDFGTPACINGLRKYSTGYIKSRKSHCQGGEQLDVGIQEYCANKISSFGWFMIVVVVIGVPLAASMFLISSKKGGRIRLPVDAQPSHGPMSVSEKIGAGLRTAGILVMEGMEVALTYGRKFYDWARQRLLQSAGYAPVRSHPMDDEIDNDPMLLDLDDDPSP